MKINYPIIEEMFNIETWMFNLDLSYRQLIVFSYVYNCIKANVWNPKEISSVYLAKLMGGKNQGNISNCLNDLCKLGLLTHSGNTSNNCCIYGLTPKVFEISKETPVEITDTTVDYSADIEQIMKAFRTVLGFDNYPIEVIRQYAIPLLSSGKTADDLCSVVTGIGKKWINSEMAVNIRPQTLFKPEKFNGYLAQANILNRTSPSNIDISFVYKVYSRIGITPPEDLTDWCAKTLRENPDMNVTALGWTIQSIYLDLKNTNDQEWLEKKMGSTNTLSKQLPKCKDTGIAASQIMGENIDNMRV